MELRERKVGEAEGSLIGARVPAGCHTDAVVVTSAVDLGHEERQARDGRFGNSCLHLVMAIAVGGRALDLAGCAVPIVAVEGGSILIVEPVMRAGPADVDAVVVSIVAASGLLSLGQMMNEVSVRVAQFRGDKRRL